MRNTKKKLSENTKEGITLAVIVVSVGICCMCVFGDIKNAVWGIVKENVPISDIAADAQGIGEAMNSVVQPFVQNITEDDDIQGFISEAESEASALQKLSSMEKCTVQRVVDGDTYILNIGDEEKRVRLIGVDTPESVAPASYGKENTEEGRTVSDIVKGNIQAGSTLYLEYDVSKTDKYERVLAYLYFENGKMVQDWLLENGYANIATYPPNVKYADHFAELAHTAAENKIGLWNGFFEKQ